MYLSQASAEQDSSLRFNSLIAVRTIMTPRRPATAKKISPNLHNDVLRMYEDTKAWRGDELC
jgi:hypothetical protein